MKKSLALWVIAFGSAFIVVNFIYYAFLQQSGELRATAIMLAQSQSIKLGILGLMAIAYWRKWAGVFITAFLTSMIMWYVGVKMPAAVNSNAKDLSALIEKGDEVKVRISDVYFERHADTPIPTNQKTFKLKYVDVAKGYAVIIGSPKAELREIGPFAIETDYLEAPRTISN